MSTSESYAGARVRLFVALDLPAQTREALASWRDRLLAGRDDLRPVAADALHLTLAFLGWRDERDVERIATVAFGAAAELPTPRLTPAGVRAIPPRGPRLFALDLEDEHDRCAALQTAVADALERERLFTPEKRPFWPHITLARVKRGARPTTLPETPPPLEPFEARDVTLYRSTLRPQGAVYDPLARTSVG